MEIKRNSILLLLKIICIFAVHPVHLLCCQSYCSSDVIVFTLLETLFELTLSICFLMKIRYLFLTLAFSPFIVIHAQSQRDSIAVYAKVMDSFTHEMLKGVKVEVLRPDSSLVSQHNTDKNYSYGRSSYNFGDEFRGLFLLRADYIFRFSKEGYVTQYANLYKRDLGRREQRRSVGEILLKKIGKRRDVELGAAEVRASKIRMVVKGDTLIYNADAFQLAEGSMLDGLIKLLPGFQLRDGQITVNGQYVSSLLVNGEDFFRGDPRVALENLPAYMVNKVKVYRKEHPWSFITKGKEERKEDLPLVVDVNLKREYSIGWVGNVGAGYGTANRYLGRAFGLRFTDHSRLALYGNANNTNDTREPGTSGNWNANGAASGRTEMQTAGFEFLVKGDKDKWKYVGHAKIYHQNTFNQSISSSETFQPTLPNSTFNRARREAEGSHFKVQTEQAYERKRDEGYFKVFGALYYQHHRSDALHQGAEFSADPKDAYRAASLDSLFQTSSERLAKMLVNRQQNQERSREHSWSGRLNASGFAKVPRTPDYYSLDFNADFEHKTGTAFSAYQLHYGQSAQVPQTNEHQRRYIDAPSTRANASLRAEYDYRPDWGGITPYLEVRESYLKGDRMFYRLDKLGKDAPTFGVLPSTTAALLQTLDAPNSYSEINNALNTTLGARCTFWLGGKLPSHHLSFTPEAKWSLEHLTYNRAALQVTPHRSVLFLTPSISWGFDDFHLMYRLNVAHPDLQSLLDYVDKADPLNVYRGNPHLQRSTSHKLELYRFWGDWKKGRRQTLSLFWDVTRNAIAHGQTYDAATGVRTFSPRNVDGNWHVAAHHFLERPFDKEKKTLFTSETKADFRNSVDFVTERSTVQNFTLEESLRFNAKIKRVILDGSIGARYWHATSERKNFQTINSFDVTYGLNAQIALPAGFAFNADCKFYQREGYSDASMNDLRFVANARLEKTFLRGRLGVALDGYDIFGGLSNVTKVINAQGIVETWHNSLPSYAMLQISYKLSKGPKKKKESM